MRSCRPGRRSPRPAPAIRLDFVLALYLRLFALGGAALLALLFFGSADDEGLTSDGSPGSTGEAAAFLSIRGLLAAMTGAGASGALVLGLLRLPQVVSVVAAVGGAYAGYRAWRTLLRRLRYFDRDHGVTLDALLGREGVLTVGIAGRNAPGIVQITLGGLSQEYTALPEQDGIFAEGARVVILRIASPSTVIVGPSPYPELPPAQ
jgi:membrane protein implicated in regulation of membrane protease activity